MYMPRIYRRKCNQCKKDYKGEGASFCSQKCDRAWRKANGILLPNRTGIKHIEETKQKMSEDRKGNKHPLFGTKKTEKERKRLSSLRIGIKHTKDVLRKMSLSHIGRKLSNETKRRIAESKKGSKSHLWRGGVTPFNKIIRDSLEYRLWRESVFRRDNWTCIWCKSKSGNGKRVILNADHTKFNSLNI